MAAIYPLLLEAGLWAGNDGNWSTWPIQVGEPPQHFNVLPATSNGETWIPLIEACSNSPSIALADPKICGQSRGVGDFEGAQSTGYQHNASSSWGNIGTYNLPVQAGLISDDQAGLYGTDNVSLHNLTGLLNLTGQSVAGIVTKDFWLGSLGVAKRAANFSTEKTIVPSLLEEMKAQNITPSASFGLDVGASYESAAGSLILGGYDVGASEGPGITVSDFESLSLAVHTRSIVLSNTLQGTVSVTHDLQSLPMTIDSSVSQLWLPGMVCDQLEVFLGLTYDSSSELYIVNDTAHEDLVRLAPEIAFTLAADSTSNVTTSIILPYAAFDLQVGPPTYNFSTNYFPIRRASKGSVLGRAFLQEAYLVVDWERSNFTVGQAAKRGNRTREIVSIYPPSKENSKLRLSVGAIVGISIGAAVLVIAIVALVWWRVRARRFSKARPPTDAPLPASSWPEDKKLAGVEPDLKELPDTNRDSIHSEAMSVPLYELHEEQTSYQLMGDPVPYELPADAMESELDAQQNEIRYQPYRSGS